MAVYKTDLETGEIIRLTDKEIKAEVQALTGWNTAQYQKEYDKLRNKLRNYEAVIGQNKPRAVNEELYNIVQRQSTVGLTERQQAILNFTSASTKQFREKAIKETIAPRLEDIAIQSLKKSFEGLIYKSDTVLVEYNLWLNEVVDVQTIKLSNGDVVTRSITRKEKGFTALELNAFLNMQAKDLHRRQREEYYANKAYYDNNDSYPGSD